MYFTYEDNTDSKAEHIDENGSVARDSPSQPQPNSPRIDG